MADADPDPGLLLDFQGNCLPCCPSVVSHSKKYPIKRQFARGIKPWHLFCGENARNLFQLDKVRIWGNPH